MKRTCQLRLILVSVVLFFKVLIINEINAQSTSVCPIGVGMEPKMKSEMKSTSYTQEEVFPHFTKWNNLKNVKSSDNQKATISLWNIQRSRVFMGKKHHFKLPKGATVHGIVLMVEGSSNNHKNIDEVQISLLDSVGLASGQNKKNEAKDQKAWKLNDDGTDHVWMYGSSSDTWGKNWTPEEINHPNFGYQIQLRNIDLDTIDIAIDQISMLVYYTPAYSFCTDKCLTFYIDKFEQYSTYQWIYPEGFTMVSKSTKDQTIDLKRTYAPHGLYQICVNIYDSNDAFVEQCCRPFLFENCNSGCFTGVTWYDKNNNGIRDGGENPIGNVQLVLFNSNNMAVDTVSSDFTGVYRFDGLTPGNYYIKSPTLPGKVFVLFNATNLEFNSDITNANGLGTTNTLVAETGICSENIDFGYVPLPSIGDFVWLDQNFNGLQDVGEAGIKDVKVTLFSANGNPVATTTSNAMGRYKFESVATGSYYLGFEPLASDFLPTFENNISLTTNSKVNAQYKTATFTISGTGENFDFDAGFYQKSRLGDLVWEDKNGNGTYQVGEPLLADVRVILTAILGNGQPFTAETTTNGLGKYDFKNLDPGIYTVEIKAPEAYFFTLSNEGDDDALDSDALDGKIQNITIKSGDLRLDVDAGLYRLGSIGNFVWLDLNANGIQDIDEKGLSGVEVRLQMFLRDSLLTLPNVLTDENGFYHFEGLAPGTYKLTFGNLSGFQETLVNIGSDSTDSDVVDFMIANISLMSGMTADTYDAGFYKLASVGDFVWEDLNANGLQDADEPGIKDVKILLSGTNNLGQNISLEKTTNAQGFYTFDSLTPGNYQLQAETPPLYFYTIKGIGSDRNLDSDGSENMAIPITLVSGQDKSDIDVGFYRNANIGDFVWEDINSNGLQDQDEAGIAAMSISLEGQSGFAQSVSRTTISDANGRYSFDGLVPGSYIVKSEGLPNLSFTIPVVGNNRAIDSDFLDGSSPLIVLKSGESNNNIDAGFVRSGSIGDFVWEDNNGNGIQDQGESGLANIKITLSGMNLLGDQVNKSVVTDANGKYLFDALTPGEYWLDIELPNRYDFTFANIGSDRSIDSDVLGGQISDIRLNSGQTITDLDIGLLRRASIGDFVFNDFNGNGIQDMGDAGLSNVQITLEGLDGIGNLVTKSTFTDASGWYAIDQLWPGVYDITVSKPFGLEWTLSDNGDDNLDSDGAKGVVTNLALSSGQNVVSLDFGLVTPISIGDFVWEDVNTNGIQDEGEPGIPGVELTLTGTNFEGLSINVSTTTNASGRYTIIDLLPGNYQIAVTLPKDFIATKALVGNDTSEDSNLSETINTYNFTIAQNTDDLTIDFGLIKLACVGDLVWEDLNCNGIRESQEPGVAGVKVLISGVDVFSAIIQKETTTDELGQYSFCDLVPGSYNVDIEVPAGYEYSAAMLHSITLNSGDKFLDVDAPLFRRSNLGDFVWNDLNENGIQDVDEPGIPNIQISLKSFSVIDPINLVTTTDVNGKYSFSNLKPGNYELTVNLGASFKATGLNVGNDGTLDNDVEESGKVSNITLFSGQTRLDIDLGLISLAKACIGDFVWEDINGNGWQDVGENGLQNVDIVLSGITQNGDNINKSTTTDVNGQYVFINLPSGNYQLQFIPSFPSFPTINAQGNDSFDSNINAEGLVQNIVLSFDTNNKTIDAGYVKPSSIGDFVWLDKNTNGLQDTDEVGLPDILLTLTDAQNNVVAETTSNESGAYMFTGLRPGEYFIEAKIPASFVLTEQSSDPSFNSDFRLIDNRIITDAITLTSNNQITDIDLGLKPGIGNISGMLWFDSNGDGLISNTEAKFDSVLVYLVNEMGDTLAVDTTDLTGAYAFDIFGSGKYQILFPAYTDSLFTFANRGNDPLLDSDVLDQSASSLVFDVALGQKIEGINAGYVRYSSIGDFVWLDSNEDGLQGANENGINGIKVYLNNNLAQVVDSTFTIFDMTTGKSGFYSFRRKPYGNYSVRFVLRENFKFTANFSGNDEANSDVVDLNNGTTALFTLQPNTDKTDIDAGFVLLAPVTGNIEGVVWQDNNNTLIREATEPLLANIALELVTLSGDIIGSTISDNVGAYRFSNIPFGDYYIKAPQISDKVFVLYSGMEVANDSDISNMFGQGTSRILNLFPGETLSAVDLGYANKITIGDFVWDDLNNDGLQSSNEPGLSNVRIDLLNQAGVVIKTTTSDALGNYTFTEVAVGRYTLVFQKLPGYIFATFNAVDPNNNSKASPTTGRTNLLDFSVQQDYFNIDVGYLKASTIGDRVWLDLNGNGIYQDSEPGILGVKVRLFNSFDIQVDSTTTNTEPNGNFIGYYKFHDVRPGSYYVMFEIPPAYLLSPSLVADVDLDSDITGANGPLTTPTFSVGIAETKNNIDAGAYLPATLGDRVWNDINQNGVQDNGEPGVPNVQVDLFTQSGLLLATQTTNSQGIYGFTGLRQRLYFLQFTLPNGFQFTSQNNSGASDTDSDVDATGTTPLISLSHGATFLDVDAGIFQTNARLIMGNIWNDENEDGLRSYDEQNGQGMRVFLKNSSDVAVDSSVTNHAGRYCFESMNTGNYYIQVMPIKDHIFSEKNVGNPSNLDSDVDEEGYSDPIPLANTYMMNQIDAGYYYKVTSSVRGYVWQDVNKNGTQDVGDKPLKDIVIFVFNASNVFVKSTKTNDRGEYNIKNLEPNEYYCKLPTLTDLDFVKYTGQNTDVDSEFTNQYGEGTSRLIKLVGGEILAHFDFGYQSTNAILPPRFKETEMSLQLYPNPTIDNIHVNMPPQLKEAAFIIVNSYGRTLIQGKVLDDKTNIDTSSLPAGRYTLHILSPEFSCTKTFIKVENW